jgi:hypothetical protein
LTIALSFLFGASAISQGQGVAGGNDHPSFPRLPNFNLAAQETQDLGRHTFADSKGEQRAVEGRKFWMRYEIAQGSLFPGVAEISRRHADIAKDAGGSIYEFTDRTLFLNFMKEGQEIWTEVSVGEDFYTLTIVEKLTQTEAPPPVQMGGVVQPPPAPAISATPSVPVPAASPPAPPVGPPSPPAKATPPRGSIAPLLRITDLGVAAVHQKYKPSWRAVSPGPDIEVLIRNNGGDYAGPMKIHVRSYSLMPVPRGQDPYPETNKTFDFEKVEISGGGQWSFGLEGAIKIPSTQWGCRRQVMVTLDRWVHNDANPGNNTMATTFFEQTGIASELSPLREVELKADSGGEWRRIRTDRTHHLRPGMYTVRFRLVSCSRTDQRYYLDMGKGSFQWVTVPGKGEAWVEIHFELPEKQKSALPMKWYRPRWDEEWKDARTLFTLSYDTNPEKSSSP